MGGISKIYDVDMPLRNIESDLTGERYEEGKIDKRSQDRPSTARSDNQERGSEAHEGILQAKGEVHCHC